MICLAPRALAGSVRPRRLAGAPTRPLNFTVRRRALVRAMCRVLLLLSVLPIVFGPQLNAQSPPPAVAKRVLTEGDAIAVVLADITRRGGDPKVEECTAAKTKDGWMVTAWHIMYPKNFGASRFVPGGFTTYIVSADGRIIQAVPGE